MTAVVAWVLDGLVVLGVVLMTIGVYGVLRLPDTYLKLHAASTVIVPGAIPLLLAAALAGAQGHALRVVPIALFLLVTAPVSAHMVARAAYLEEEERSHPADVTGEPNDPEG